MLTFYFLVVVNLRQTLQIIFKIYPTSLVLNSQIWYLCLYLLYIYIDKAPLNWLQILNKKINYGQQFIRQTFNRIVFERVCRPNERQNCAKSEIQISRNQRTNFTPNLGNNWWELRKIYNRLRASIPLYDVSICVEIYILYYDITTHTIWMTVNIDE